MPIKEHSHSTDDEIEFIRDLGLHLDNIRTDNYRLKLLQKYITSIDKRKKWDDINKYKIQLYANELYTSVLCDTLMVK